jgi:uncharacterized protein with von Willebrand factor type A (vWA) domain
VELAKRRRLELVDLVLKPKRDEKYTSIDIMVFDEKKVNQAIDTMLLAILQLVFAGGMDLDEAIERMTKRMKKMAGAITIDPAQADA